MERTVQNNVKEDSSSGNEVQIVEFILGDDKFAVNLFDVREIVESFRITPLPHSASHIKGIIDLRGEITTVIDLKTLLKITKNNGSSARDSRFIVLDEGITQGKTGIMVDDVTSVLTVSTEDIDKTSQGTGEDSYILGVIKKPVGDQADLRKELVIWIDIQNLLKDAGN